MALNFGCAAAAAVAGFFVGTPGRCVAGFCAADVRAQAISPATT
jgi:hypothetical protein